MSEPRVLTVGLAAEGPTDHAILSAIVERLSPFCVLTILPLQPDLSDSFEGFGPHGAGWKGVRGWCREVAGDWGGIRQFLSPALGPPIDVLVVHVDADIASDREIDVEEPCPPPASTTTRLREVVRGSPWQRSSRRSRSSSLHSSSASGTALSPRNGRAALGDV